MCVRKQYVDGFYSRVQLSSYYHRVLPNTNLKIRRILYAHAPILEQISEKPLPTLSKHEYLINYIIYYVNLLRSLQLLLILFSVTGDKKCLRHVIVVQIVYTKTI